MYVYENIWNIIGKGKYKLSYVLWVGMWVKEEITQEYTKLKEILENIWNIIGKGKYKLNVLWVGMWVRKK